MIYVLLLSLSLPLATIVILASMLLGQTSPNEISIGTNPCDAMALYGLSELLALNMIFESSYTRVKFIFGTFAILLLALAIPINNVMSITLAIILPAILTIINKKTRKTRNRQFYSLAVGAIAMVVSGQFILCVNDKGYNYTLTIILVLFTYLCLLSAAHALSKIKLITDCY